MHARSRRRLSSSGVRLDDGAGHLPEVVIGYADDEAVQRRRMLGQHHLDLAGVDLASADVEHVDAPVAQVEEAIVAEPADVADGVPPVADDRFGPDVAVGGARRVVWAQVDLADCSRVRLATVLVQDLHVTERHRSDRTAVRQPLRAVDHRDRLHLGAAVELPHITGTQDVDPRLFHGGRAWRGHVPQAPQGGQVVRVRCGLVGPRKALQHGRDGGHPTRPVPANQPEALLGVEACGQDDVMPEQPPGQGRHRRRVVRQRPGDEHGLVGLDTEHGSGTGGIQTTVVGGGALPRAAGVASRGYRFRRLRHHPIERGGGKSGVRHESGRHAPDGAAGVLAADQQRPRRQRRQLIELALGKSEGERLQGRAKPLDRNRGLQQFDRVWERDSEQVRLTYPTLPIRPSESVRRRLQLAASDGDVLTGQGRQVVIGLGEMA